MRITAVKPSLTFSPPPLKSHFIPALIFCFALVLHGRAQVPPPPSAAMVKRMFDPWRAPVPPRHIVANIHYVGTIGVSSFLITTPAGHILLDTTFDDTVPLIQKSVEQLGFKMADIKIILSSHAHIDHVGGHARMQKITGAKIVASAADAKLIETGGDADFLQWPKESILYPRAHVDRIVADGEKVTLGGVSLTAHLTPGHTRGATTWTMEVSEGGRSHHVVFFSSATINAGTRLVGNPSYPRIAEDLAATFEKLKAMRCDIFLAPHGGQFSMAEKFARAEKEGTPNAFVDPEGFRQTVAGMEKYFLQQLAAEKAAVSAATPAK
jgi:metallo-beta-lactamase class B